MLARDGSGGLDLSDTVTDAARVLVADASLRNQLLAALTEDNRLHVDVRCSLLPTGSMLIDNRCKYI